MFTPQQAKASAPQAIFGWRDKDGDATKRRGMRGDASGSRRPHRLEEARYHTHPRAPDRLLDSRDMVRMEVGLIMASV